ncbi:MAG: hypothetical protein ACYCVD_00965 [Desulfitobacteriaceae bacterium]
MKFIAKQEGAVQELIRKALTGLSIRPPIGDIKPLKGQGKIMRLRVGCIQSDPKGLFTWLMGKIPSFACKYQVIILV